MKLTASPTLSTQNWYLTNCTYLTISYMKFYSIASTIRHDNIYIKDCNHLTLSYNEIDYTYGWGTVGENSPYTKYLYNSFTSLPLTETEAANTMKNPDAINMKSTYGTEIAFNTFHSRSRTIWHSSLSTDPENHTASRDIIEIGYTNLSGTGAITKIHDNFITTDFQGSYCGTDFVTAQQCAGEIWVYNNIVVAHNSEMELFQANSDGATGTYNLRVWNNTFIMTNTDGPHIASYGNIESNVDLFEFRNNVCYFSETSSISGGASQIQTNNFINTGFTLVDNDFTSLNTDTSVYRIASGSAIDGGMNLSAYFTNDLAGHTRSGTWDGGAFEQVTPPVPVELTSFSAKIIKGNVNLNWQTATEVNNFGFDIERKSLNEWQRIGFVNGNGNSNSPKEYSFTDNKLIGGTKFQYRLKQIDNDGQFEYSDVVEVAVVPTEFALYQNYPNPFNPVTMIRYQLPKESKAVIKIYNVLGSEVMEIVNEQKEAGIYEVEFNAEALSSGTYIYKISADNFVQTKKMTLLK
jgi:hypothetical protein